jgi:putative membrane-bound dehydrogenase-like protein
MKPKHTIAHCFVCLLSLLITGSVWGQVSPEESLKLLKPAEGFEVSLWAHEPMVNNPTGMDIDSRGRVWIAEGLNYRLWAKREDQFERVPGADRVRILHDTDGDGRADKVTVFADNIYPPPLGLAVQEIWKDGKYRGARVYVGNSPDLLVLEDTDGDDRADRRYPLLTGFGGIDSDHGLHGMALGPDGKLYFTQGDARYGKDKIEGGDATFDVVDKSGRRLRSARYGTTLRVNLDGTNFEVLGYRQRNNYETCVDSFGHVFTSDNDDDGERGCRMIWLMDGGDYGYQTPQSSRHSAEELPGIVPKLVGTGNGAPSGILVYEGDLFPEECHGAVMQLDAGTHQVNFHPLVRHGAAFRSDYRVLLSSDDSWFRPVDATVAPDGSLFVCDWYDAGVGGNRFSDQNTGRIYRLKPTGSTPLAAVPDFGTLSGQINALRSPNVATRFAARQALLQRGVEAREPLRQLFRNGSGHEQARALFLLAELPETGEADVHGALKHDDPRIRELALHVLARDLARESVVAPESAMTVAPRAVRVLDDIVPLIDDPDAGVRRELILALRNVETSQAGESLRKLAASWDGRDRYYLEALHLALTHREPAFLAELFDSVAERALADGWGDETVALPPYFPIATNDAYLHMGDELPPANAASKLIGLAWVLGRSEALTGLRAILKKNDSPDIAQGADMALGRIQDPRAAELLIDRFLAVDDSQRQREILQRLGSKLAGAWKPMLNEEKMCQVFNMALARDDLRVEAIKSIARSGATEYGARLLALADDDQQELSTRAAALETLGKLRYEPARTMATRLVEQAQGQSRGGPLALAALSTLSDFRADQSRQLFEAVISDGQYPLDFRRRALQLLAATPDGARQLLTMHRREQLDADLVTEVTFLLHNHADRQIRQIAREQIPLPTAAGGKQIADLNEVLALGGDPGRGRELFHRQGNNTCASCHRVQGVGNWVGPDLSSIGTKYGKSELLYHVLNPSGAINYDYVSYTLALADGRVLTGLITDQTADRLVLKTAQGQRIEIASDEIELKQAQNVSIMPANLVETMTEQDLADLIAYLATLRQPVSAVGQYYLLGPLATGTYDGAAPPDLQKSWPGVSGGRVRWQRSSTSRDDRLDLSSLLGSQAGSEIYCFVPYASPRAQDARIVVTTTSTIQLWHNGQPVALERPAKDDSATLWQGSLKLQAGANRLTIRVASGQVDSGLITTLITGRAIHFDFD